MKHQVSFRVIQQYTVLFVPVCGILLSQFTATVVEPVVFFHFFHKKKKLPLLKFVDFNLNGENDKN